MSYKAKAADSFRTKMNLFRYERCSTGRGAFTLEEFKAFEVEKRLVDEYVEVYWQQPRTYLINGRMIGDIESGIKNLSDEMADVERECERDYVSRVFPALFSETQFQELLKADHCHYCGITVDAIENMAAGRFLRKKSLRGWSLEIDRLDSNYEYSPENCRMCCYWCNNAKTDEFTPEEFKPIGEAIRRIWQSRQSRRIERYGSDGSEVKLVDL